MSLIAPTLCPFSCVCVRVCACVCVCVKRRDKERERLRAVVVCVSESRERERERERECVCVYVCMFEGERQSMQSRRHYLTIVTLNMYCDVACVMHAQNATLPNG